jgi:hypothetical protein
MNNWMKTIIVLAVIPAVVIVGGVVVGFAFLVAGV